MYHRGEEKVEALFFSFLAQAAGIGLFLTYTFPECFQVPLEDPSSRASSVAGREIHTYARAYDSSTQPFIHVTSFL